MIDVKNVPDLDHQNTDLFVQEVLDIKQTRKQLFLKISMNVKKLLEFVEMEDAQTLLEASYAHVIMVTSLMNQKYVSNPS